MHKESSYQEKFTLLEPWLTEIITTTKKDLKKEHLKNDYPFFKKNFPGKNLSKLSVDDMMPVYQQKLSEGDEELAGFIANRWIVQNAEVYELFEGHLQTISSNFDELHEIENTLAQKMITESIQSFGATTTYIFSVLNSVVFSPDCYAALRQAAEEMPEQETTQDEESIDTLKKQHERAINRYEKKLAGLQRKYINDTAALKKQIAQLHRRLNEKAG